MGWSPPKGVRALIRGCHCVLSGHVRYNEMAIHKPGREPSPGTTSAGTLTLDSQLPAL